ncbi:MULTISPECIES: hypothetical protein [Streptosporangium]|uniref:Uncharacterized protein n=1 Tax=Streptosporangium brasiliense TaxID=47480 RepID=A0ABT9QYL5_9ACTN|nr:hypothetical protein [Streptosporangium brasiliense]MDP9862074.1 hypothetical protein [Streptosporangium brasiliense]
MIHDGTSTPDQPVSVEAGRPADDFPIEDSEWPAPLAQSPDAQPEGDPDAGRQHDWLPRRAQSPDDME